MSKNKKEALDFIINSYEKPTITRIKPENEEKEHRTIELSIELDSWSPVYEKSGIRYREKLASNIFENDGPIEKQKINSYLDHNISIEHLLASTKNKTMEVVKNENRIIATIKVDEENKLLKKVADLIEQGVIESNSFIFKSLDYEINEKPEDKNIDLEIIFTKAKLISIDPVYEGFYPQDRCRVYSKEKPEFDFLDLSNYKQKQKGESMKEIKKETLEEQDVLKTALNLIDIYKKEAGENLNKFNDIKADFEKYKQEMLEQQEKQEQELKTLREERDQKMEFIKQENNKTFNNKPNKKDFSELRAKSKKGKLETEEKIEMYNQAIDYLDAEKIKEIETIDRQTAQSLEKRALDGTTNLKGLALIETHNMPGILSEWNAVFPEFTEYSQKFSLTGLDEITKAIYVSDKSLITNIAENADSTAFGGQTFKVKLKPERYSVKLTQNNALTHGDELWVKQIEDAKNAIIRALRKKFYGGIFTHAATAMPTDGSYTGGVTQEAKFLTETTNQFTFQDIDKLIKQVEGQYGEGVLNDFILAMHPDVLAKLEAPYLNSTTASFINTVYNPITKKYRGLQIITSTEYPDKETTKGKKVALLFNKGSICAYGLSFVISEDQYTDLSKDATNRYVKTRGEIKLIDPYVNSRFIEVK